MYAPSRHGLVVLRPERHDSKLGLIDSVAVVRAEFESKCVPRRWVRAEPTALRWRFSPLFSQRVARQASGSGAKKIPTMVLGCPTRRHSCSVPALHPCSCALRTDGRDASADGWLHCTAVRTWRARKHSSLDECRRVTTASLFSCASSVCQTSDGCLVARHRKDPRPQQTNTSARMILQSDV